VVAAAVGAAGDAEARGHQMLEPWLVASRLLPPQQPMGSPRLDLRRLPARLPEMKCVAGDDAVGAAGLVGAALDPATPGRALPRLLERLRPECSVRLR